MLFNTWLYAFFLGGTFALYWLLPTALRPWVLSLFGLIFYTKYYAPHTLLIAALTITVFGASHLIRHTRGRGRVAVFVAAVTLCVGALAYYKYTGFALRSAGWLSHFLGGAPRHDINVNIRPPLAISFFTFEYVHYLVEIYRGAFEPAGARNFFLFILFFPSLVSGPIKRFRPFDEQIGNARLDHAQVAYGLERILVGLAKKVAVADPIALATAPVWKNPMLLALAFSGSPLTGTPSRFISISPATPTLL